MRVKSIYPEISAACSRADTGLWRAFTRNHQRDSRGSGAVKFVFPEYRDSSLRVSEQEARCAFVEALYMGPLLYSVEAPTSKLYQFTGKTPRSAQTDLAIHNVDGARICNVEFKTKGLSPSAKKHFMIYKDLQKLLREPQWGLWFHLFEAVNNSTINEFLKVIATEMNRVRGEFVEDIESPGLTIHICVLQHGFSIQRDLIFMDATDPPPNEVDRLLQLDLRVSRSELLTVTDNNGWTLSTRND